MSSATPPPARAARAFRIPMRGYEIDNITLDNVGMFVPNPHEGL